MNRLFGLQQRPRPFSTPDDTTTPAPSAPAPAPAGNPPTLTPAPAPAPAPATPAAPGDSTPAKPKRTRTPKAAATPPEQQVNVKIKATNPVELVEQIPTPGGLVLMLVFVAIFLFMIVPVSGKKTRARLLWDTLLGKTSLPDGTPAAASSNNTRGLLPGGIDNTPVGIAPTLGATGSGSPIAPGLSAAASMQAPTTTVTGYDSFTDAYPDAWSESAYPQAYTGETVYETPDFPEYG